MVKTIKTPPELIDAVLKQVETHCQKNRTIDQAYLVINLILIFNPSFKTLQIVNQKHVLL